MGGRGPRGGLVGHALPIEQPRAEALAARVSEEVTHVHRSRPHELARRDVALQERLETVEVPNQPRGGRHEFWLDRGLVYALVHDPVAALLVLDEDVAKLRGALPAGHG